MSKLRCDSRWNGLTAEQRETLEGWLFVENAGYGEVRERCAKEFGITTSLKSLAVFYRRLARERMRGELLEVKGAMEGISGARVNAEAMGHAAMTLVAKQMLLLGVESPEKVKEMVSLGRVLVANQMQETRRRWLRMEEEREFRRLEDERETGRIWREMNRAEEDMKKIRAAGQARGDEASG